MSITYGKLTPVPSLRLTAKLPLADWDRKFVSCSDIVYSDEWPGVALTNKLLGITAAL